MPTALMGDGAKLLIASEDAKDRVITGSALIRDEMIEAGADWRDEDVVLSGNLVSGTGADVVHEVMEKFAELVAGYESEVNEAA